MIINNHTQTIPFPSIFISVGHLASVFSLVVILIIILLTLFLLFTKQKDQNIYDEYESPNEISSNMNEQKSFEFQQFKQYSSTFNNQQYPSINSFQMDTDEQHNRSTVNLLATK